MKRGVITMILGLAFALTGCFQKSLNPYYTQESLVDMQGITGVWEDDDGYKISITRERLGVYEMLAVDPESGSLAKFDLHAFKLGGSLYWDLFPDDIDPEIPNKYYALNLIGVHAVSKILFTDNRLELLALSPKWVHALQKEGKLAVAATCVTGDEVVFTASSKDLQVFLASIADSEGAYEVDDSIVWKREE